MRNADLEQLILADPDDDEGYVVYGDWLQERDDPRGELIAIQQRLHNDPDNLLLRAAQAELIHRKRQTILGPLAAHLDACGIKWRLGFIDSIWLHGALSLEQQATKVEELLAALIAAESAAFLREVTLGQFNYRKHTRGDAQAVLDALLALPLPTTIRSLFVFDDIVNALRTSLAQVGEVLPDLQQLVVHGWAVFLDAAAPRLPKLRALSLHGGEEALSKNLGWLGEGHAQLEDLAIWFDSAVDYSLLLKLLDGRLPRLKHLRLRHLSRPVAVFDQLLKSPIAGQLETLELSMSQLADRNASKLLRGAPKLPRLRRLALFGNRLSEPTQARLVQAYPGAFVGLQRPSDLAFRHVRYDGRDEQSFLELRGLALCLPDEASYAAADLKACGGAGRTLYSLGTRLLAAATLAQSIPILRCSLDFPAPWVHRRAYSNLAIAYADSAMYPFAIETSRRAIERYPDDPNLHAILISALRHDGDLDAALAALQASRQTISETAEGIALVVSHLFTLLAAGRATEAVRAYESFTTQPQRETYTDYEPRPRVQAAQMLRLRACAALAYAHDNQLERAVALASELPLEDDEREVRQPGRPNTHYLPILHHALACIAARAGHPDRAREARRAARELGYYERAFLDADPLLARL